MPDSNTSFQRVPIRPVDCLSESWDLLSGQYWLFFGISLVGMLIQAFVPLNILTGPMMCGIFIAWFQIMKGKKITFELLFKGFDFFGDSLIATLIMVGVAFIVMIPSYVVLIAGIIAGSIAAQDAPEIMGWATLLSVSVFMLIMLTMMTVLMTLGLFIYPLIVDRKLKAFPAIRTSIEATWANLGGILALLGLTSLIATVASLFCIIPIFFVTPWCIGAIGVAYRRVFPEIPTEATPVDA